MRMSELSARSGVPIATIKYYLRDGLLHPGVATGATRASYDESHARRLRLIRALADVAGMRLEQVRSVLAAVDDPETSVHDALGSALMPGSPGADADPRTRDRADRLIDSWQWTVEPDSYNRDSLASALAVLESLDFPLSDEMLGRYAEAMHGIAETEVADVPTDSRENAVVHGVIGTLLVEPVLASIRRLAHEEASRRRLGAATVRRGRRSRA